MTVAVASRKLLFPSISGSTGPFSFNFRILMRGVGSTTPQITVTKYSAAGAPTVLNYPADYTFVASNGGLNGGTITLAVAGGVGESLLVNGSTPVDQPTRYASLGKFDPEKHEASYDQGILIQQEQVADVARSVKIPLADTAGTAVELPLAALRATKMLAFDATGNVIVSNQSLATIEAGSTSAAASAVLASQWASQTSGIVAATDFSAKAWAIGGTGVTTTAAKGAAKEWATTTTGAVDTVDYSAKAYALGGTGITGTIGSAKEWAISGSKPDGVNESAKTYAAQASASASSASTSATNAANSAAAINFRYCGTAGGTANALTLTPTAPLASYTGALLEFTIASANTTEAMTVNVSALGLKNIKVMLYGAKRDAAIGMFQTGMHCIGQYDGTDVVIINAPWDNQASDVASAGTVALASATGNFANLTGTTGVTAITGLTKGRRMLFRHTGVHTLTHSATLFLLNGAANITTAVGDFSEWVTDGTNVYMTRYCKADGTPVTFGTNTITNTNLAQMAARTIKGNATNGTANASDIAMGTNSVLASNSTTVAAVALSASQLMGRGSSGDAAAITLGTGLSMSGTTLSSAAGSTTISDQTVTTVSSVNITGLASYKTLFLSINTTAISVGLGLYLRFSTDNGSSFISSSDYQWIHTGSSSASSASDTALHLGDNTLTTQRTICAVIQNINLASQVVTVQHAVQHTNPFLYHGCGSKLTAAAVNAIQILTSSGTFSGRVTLTGI